MMQSDPMQMMHRMMMCLQMCGILPPMPMHM